MPTSSSAAPHSSTDRNTRCKFTWILCPRGSYVTAKPYFTYHQKKYLPDPEKFDPERFAADRCEEKDHRYVWELFGGGVHKYLGLNFVGMEVKSIMHHALLGYQWSVDSPYVPPLNFHSLSYPTDGLPVNFQLLRTESDVFSA
ncbi:MAG: cytochrome P450 [Mycobacteriaceae bacterium]